MELSRDAGRIRHVFLRFNPDEYFFTREKVRSCWGRAPKTGEPRLAPKQRKQWEERLEKLASIIAEYRGNAPSKDVEVIYLFFSER